MQHLAVEKRNAQVASALPRADRAALQHEQEAVLAAVFSQVHRRDTVITQGSGLLAQTAADAWFAHTGAPMLHAVQADAETCASLAAGCALRIHDRLAVQGDAETERRSQPVVIALLQGFSPLLSITHLVQQHDLALVVVASGDMESRAAAQRRQHSTGVPTMPVDRADAVAVCRVVQECLLRARNGWGGAVVHAAPFPGALNPLALIRQHLQRRGLLRAVDLDETGQR